MKNTFKRIALATLIALTQTIFASPKTANAQLGEMYKKVEEIHAGFELIFLKGQNKGHELLLKIEAICLNCEDSQAGKKLNELAKKLNAVLKTIHNIVSKHGKKGKAGFAPFLFEIGKSCNIEELFKTTICDLQEIQKILDSVNKDTINQQELKDFIGFVKKIQPLWHEALLQKESIIKNLRESL